MLIGDGGLLLGIRRIRKAAVLPDAFEFAAAGGDEPHLAAFVWVYGMV